MRLLTVHCRSGETGLIAHLLVTNEGSVPEQGREKSSSFSFYPLLAIDDYYLHYAKLLVEQNIIIADVGQVLPEP